MIAQDNDPDLKIGDALPNKEKQPELFSFERGKDLYYYRCFHLTVIRISVLPDHKVYPM